MSHECHNEVLESWYRISENTCMLIRKVKLPTHGHVNPLNSNIMKSHNNVHAQKDQSNPNNSCQCWKQIQKKHQEKHSPYATKAINITKAFMMAILPNSKYCCKCKAYFFIQIPFI